MGLLVGLPSYWVVFVQGLGGNVRGLLLDWVAFASGGELHSLSSLRLV